MLEEPEFWVQGWCKNTRQKMELLLLLLGRQRSRAMGRPGAMQDFMVTVYHRSWVKHKSQDTHSLVKNHNWKIVCALRTPTLYHRLLNFEFLIVFSCSGRRKKNSVVCKEHLARRTREKFHVLLLWNISCGVSATYLVLLFLFVKIPQSGGHKVYQPAWRVCFCLCEWRNKWTTLWKSCTRLLRSEKRSSPLGDFIHSWEFLSSWCETKQRSLQLKSSPSYNVHGWISM